MHAVFKSHRSDKDEGQGQRGTPVGRRGGAGADIAEPATGDAHENTKRLPCRIPERPRNSTESLKVE